MLTEVLQPFPHQGSLVIAPFTLPHLLAKRLYCPATDEGNTVAWQFKETGFELENVAPTFVFPFIAIEQVVFVPEQAPVQPAKVEPAAGVTVKLSNVPELTLVEQDSEQMIP